MSLVKDFYNSGEVKEFENQILDNYIENSDLPFKLDSNSYKALEFTIPKNLDEFQNDDKVSNSIKSSIYLFKDDSGELQVYDSDSKDLLSEEDKPEIIDQIKLVLFLRELQAAKYLQNDSTDSNSNHKSLKIAANAVTSYSKHLIENNLVNKAENKRFIKFVEENKKSLNTLWGLAYTKVFNSGTWQGFLVNQAFKQLPSTDQSISNRKINTNTINFFRNKANSLFHALDKK